jgi:hypothetical protein
MIIERNGRYMSTSLVEGYRMNEHTLVRHIATGIYGGRTQRVRVSSQCTVNGWSLEEAAERLHAWSERIRRATNTGELTRTPDSILGALRGICFQAQQIGGLKNG